jgi:hypothetical protein
MDRSIRKWAEQSGARVAVLLPAMIAAASPGLSRFALVAGLAAIYGLEQSGPVSNDLAILYFAGFGTATGWATTLISMGSAQKVGAEQSLRVCVLGAILTTVACAPLFFFVKLAVIGPMELAALLCSYGMYQCVRSFFVASGRLVRTAALDVAAHLLPLMVVWLGFQVDVRDAGVAFAAFGASMAVLSALFLWRTCESRADAKATLSASALLESLIAVGRQAVPVGLAMLVSSGALFTFVPLVFLVGAPPEATIAALIVNLLAAASLVPRAITLRYLPILSRALIESPASVGRHFRQFRAASVRSTLVITLVVGLSLVWVSEVVSARVLYLIICLAAGTLAPLYATAEIHLLIVKGRSSRVLIVNATWILPYFAGLVLIGAEPSAVGTIATIGLGAAFLIGNLARTIKFLRSVRDEESIFKARASS